MLTLARLKVQLGLALVLGGIALNLWAGLSFLETLANLFHALTDSEVWLLMAITVLIMELGRFMTKKRNSDEIIAATNRWGGRHGRAASLMALPAMIGLIPMPGGALLSAPFVEKAGDREGSKPEWKSGINYWFRHIWEYWWPMYPGVIVAMTIFDLDLRVFVAVQFLFTPVAIFAGYIFMIRPHLKRLADKEVSAVKHSPRVWFLMIPMIIILASLFFLPTIIKPLLSESLQSSSKMISFLVGMIMAIAVVYFDEIREAKRGASSPKQPAGSNCATQRVAQTKSVPISERHSEAQRASSRILLAITEKAFPKVMFSSLLKWKSINVLISLGGVLVFKVMLISSGLLPVASDDLVQSGIPIVIVVAALPFLAGLVTGIALGFAGTAFPLIVGLMGVEGVNLTPLATLVLAYGFGYMGMMLSPVHLCLLVTKDYFDAPMQKIYRQIVPCVLCILVYCITAHLLLSWFGL